MPTTEQPALDRRALLCAALLALAGCNERMTNEEIIAAHAQCRTAGMDSRVYVTGWDYLPVAVVCFPKDPTP